MIDQPFRAQVVNLDTQTSVWFGFDSEAEAKLCADRLNFALSNMPVNAIVGAYPADAKCPRKQH